MIRLDGIGFRYPGQPTILRAVSALIDRGDKLVLMGANGTGKSTLLKLLNGLLSPTEGTYGYDGEEVTAKRLKQADFARRFRQEVVLLFQNPDSMLFNPTVYDEIAFGPRQFGFDDTEDRVAYWAGVMELEERLQAPPFKLSGGEKQRLCLATLLALDPKVLLLDEPAANMDPRSTGWLVDFLQELDQTTIVTTHNLSLAAELGDRCLVLGKQSGLVYDGTAADLLRDEDKLIEANLVHSHRHRHGEREHRHYHVHDWD